MHQDSTQFGVSVWDGSACWSRLLLRVAALAFARYLAPDLGILSLQRSFFAQESGREAVDSSPRLLERFVCSLEGLMTLPQDIA